MVAEVPYLETILRYLFGTIVVTETAVCQLDLDVSPKWLERLSITIKLVLDNSCDSFTL